MRKHLGMDAHPPKILYKYLDAEGAIKTLENCSLKFSSPLELNDPFECLYGAISQKSRDELYRLLFNARYFKKDWIKICDERFGIENENEALRLFNIAEFSDLFEILFEMMFRSLSDNMHRTFPKMRKEVLIFKAICCFSDKWDNLLMWGHYAGKHTGCVIGFDSNEIARQVGNPLQVRYPQENKRVPMPTSTTEVREMADKAMRTKAKDWEYEDEWRVISNITDLESKGGVFTHTFEATAVKEIIIGMRADAHLKQSMAHFWQKPTTNCKFYFAYPNSSDFKLERQLFKERMADIALNKEPNP